MAKSTHSSKIGDIKIYKQLLAFMHSFKAQDNTRSSLQDEVSNLDGMEDGGFLRLMAKIDVSISIM